MPQFNLADYGVVGFVLLIIIVTIWKLPEIATAFKGDKSSIEDEGQEETILQNLTTAITKLTTFLETDSAVNKEKDKALYSSIKDIHSALVELQKNDNELMKIMTEHALKCDMSCMNKRRKDNE